MGVGKPSSASNAEEYHVVPPPQEALSDDGEGNQQPDPLMDSADFGGEAKP